MAELTLSPTRLRQLREATRVADAYRTRRLDSYRPKAHQSAFHALGKTTRERAMMANNQGGKTVAGSMEVAFHLTGRYPPWWRGVRYLHPVKVWASNTNIDTTRDNPQRLLLGEDTDEMLGTGAIPRETIGKLSYKQIPGAVDRVLVKHVSGQWSRLAFKAYDQKREKWQGETLDFIWFDEEPPDDVYSEGLARISMARQGRTILTLTPLLGMTTVVGYFYPEPNTVDRSLTMVTIENCGLYTPEQIEKIVSAYPEYEREARTLGRPMMGRGRVFPVARSVYTRPWRDLPKSWPWLIGMDFGWDHPTAAVKVAYDRENDCLYVTQEYTQKEGLISVNASALKAMGGVNLPVVWPHDGGRLGDAKSGISTAELYRREGVRMWPEKATYPDGTFPLEASVQEMLDRMRTGRLVIFDSCPMLLNEIEGYHRKFAADRQKTIIVPLKDDLIAATRYALMMRRVGRADEVERLHRAGTRATLEWDPLEDYDRRTLA